MNVSAQDNVTAALEYLTGPARGTVSWLNGTTLDVMLREPRLVRISEAGTDNDSDQVIARLHLSGDTYEIETVGDRPLWVNGIRVDAKRLQHRDMIEFGETGPLSRFELHYDGGLVRKSVLEIVGDCMDYTRVSRKPMAKRVRSALTDLLKGLARQTTVLFRLSVLASIVVLIAVAYVQHQSSERLKQQLKSDSFRLETFSRALNQAKKESLKPVDLIELRRDVDRHLSAAAERLNTLEKRSTAISRVISSARQSVVFLQGAYGFRHKDTGAVLRHSVNADGRPLLSPRGQPLLTLEGDGPAATREFTGTAFVIAESGILLTNRHVALPWEDDASLEALDDQGLEPYLVRFLGYLPNEKMPFEVGLLKASDSADIALLLCGGVTAAIPSLGLGESPNPGNEVIVMGYPTGLRSMLAQTGKSFLEELQTEADLDFWAIAARLSQARFIQPLASRGIVGQVSPSAVVYDAETTHGGSGGPVLDMNGQVVAVNTAIIPEYGGSNFGVPVSFVRELLQEANLP